MNSILIAGAGIGGLSAALALAQAGFKVTMCEQALQLGEVGAGLQISPNALKVLQKLGVDEGLSQHAFVPQYATMRNFKTGEYYLKMPLAKSAVARYGASYWHLHRADLHRVLSDACEEIGVELMLNATVSEYRQAVDQVSLVLQDGRELTADLLVGADGIRSIIREQMLGKEKPTFMGQVAWRGVIPVSDLRGISIKPDACVWVGPNRHFVSYYLRGGEYVNFVAVEERSDWQSESWREEGDVQELRRAFADWHPEVSELLQSASSTFLWALNGRDELPSWHQDRVVLLGDACHPMLPFMAQGAAMAIEDAYVLAQSLVKLPLAEALDHYEKMRKPRATSVQKMSKDNAALYHMQGGILGKMKLNAIRMASQYMPSIIQSKLDPVYAHDVTL
ncbi:FAD-dependent monooxygenase [Marinomonas transparens]|uniref:FAD-dependent monooxygenase n=1 Tax=Marinomonas transparens TaxID=2795388 RepID=A0A934JTL3_9GAMM|nr:FAD-dependent monooxygenase [Marinomonas transparens]MBJ7537140.1 FAD-dependent monooxygenase [Marinomonas transparens]